MQHLSNQGLARIEDDTIWVEPAYLDRFIATDETDYHFADEITDFYPYEPDYTSVIEHIKKFETAHKIFEKMEKRNVKAISQTVYNLIRKTDYTTARSIIDTVWTQGVEIDTYVYHILMLQMPIKSMTAIQMFIDEMWTRGITPSTMIYNDLIGKCPNYEAAQKVFDDMKITPNSGNYTSLIGSCPNYETAQKVFDDMIAKVIIPNFNNVVSVLNVIKIIKINHHHYEEKHRTNAAQHLLSRI